MSSWSASTTIRSRGRPSRRQPRAPLSSCTKCGRKRTSLSRRSTWSIITSRTFKYVSFKKEAKRETPAAVTKREVWKGDLQDVFDIASSKIAEANAAEEVFAFLELKREDRLGCR